MSDFRRMKDLLISLGVQFREHENTLDGTTIEIVDWFYAHDGVSVLVVFDSDARFVPSDSGATFNAQLLLARGGR